MPKSKAQLFSGKIENLNHPELIILTLQDHIFWRKDTVYADQDGKFSIMLQLNSPGYIRLWASNFKNETIYMLPETTLNIEADGKDSQTFWDTQQFSGSAALFNNFYAEISRNENLLANGFDAKTYQLPEQRFLEHIENYYDLRARFKTDYFNQHKTSGIPDTEVSDFRMIDSIQMAYEKNSVYRSYVQFLPKGKQHQFYADYIEPYAQYQMDDWRYLTSNNYRWFFATYLRRQFNLKNEERKEKGLEVLQYYDYYREAPELMRTHLIKPLQRYVSEALLEILNMDYPSVNDTLLAHFDYSATGLYLTLDHPERESWYSEKLTEILDFKKNIRAGQPAFAFEMQDASGQKVTLAEFKGKILYIDLWASWCGPCIAQFPSGRKLEEEFAADNRVVFLSLSLDDLEEDWKGGMAQYNPPGQQFWIKGGMKSSFVQDYAVIGIPHYLLIDEKGNFITYKAPRPGDTNIREVLQEALDNVIPQER